MGKKQHQKDRLYLATKEWQEEWGGKKAINASPPPKVQLNVCALSMTPTNYPVCLKDGTIFDIHNIISYIQKYHKNPLSGTPLSTMDLIKLKFCKYADGKLYCPILEKVFTDHSHIVAIRTTGNVFSYEAVYELNFKTKIMRDLITDEPFKRSDIITIQDPTKMIAFQEKNQIYTNKKTNKKNPRKKLRNT
jgi:peptidyl-prolyl cis-trans isomerase-like protein 2